MLAVRSALPGAALAGLTAVVVMGGASLGYGVAWSAADAASVGGLLAALVAVHAYAARSDAALRRAGLALVAVVLATGVINLVAGLWVVHSYGDGAFLVRLVERRAPFPRWLAGSALLSWTYAGVWTFPPLAARLPAGLASAGGFVSLASMACMAACAAVALRSRRVPLAVYATTTSTIFLAFSLGYVEYYPFVAGFLLLLLAWVFGSPWERIDPRALGLALGAMASAYVGFWPLVAILGLAFVLAAPRRNWPALAWGAAAYLFLVRFLWPESPPHYFASLWKEMNFGERHIPPEYAGWSAGPTSVYFATARVLTLGRLRELVYQAFFGGALGTFLLLCGVAGAAAWNAGRAGWRRLAGRVAPGLAARLAGWAADRAGTLAAVAVLVYYVRYFGWKIPKLGLRGDIDLYFAFYLLVAFFLGLGLEKGATGRPLTSAGRFLVLSFLAGGTVPLCYLFIAKGLPNP